MMTRYHYLGLDPAGRERRGAIQAESADAAAASLKSRRLHVVRIEAGSEGPAEPLLSPSRLGRARLNSRQLGLFTRQLATLTQVSPVEESLRTLARQAERRDVGRVLGEVHRGVVAGRSLSESLASEPRSFPSLYRAMVAAGEESGTLPSILDRLAGLLERQAQVRGRIIAALAYPLILSVLAIFVVLALMIFVVPKVVEQFDQVGQTLPSLTRAVIALSNFLSSWWWALAALLAAGFIVGARLLGREPLRLRFDSFLLRLPLIGGLIRDLHAARMARTLSTMVAARLPLLEGLRLTSATIRNRALRAASERIAESVRTGGSLSSAMRAAGVFPPLLIYLAESGEASGRLDLMLERAADYLEREFDTFTSTALSLLEPAIIIIMGVIVALIVLSILLPILQLDTLAGGY